MRWSGGNNRLIGPGGALTRLDPGRDPFFQSPIELYGDAGIS